MSITSLADWKDPGLSKHYLIAGCVVKRQPTAQNSMSMFETSREVPKVETQDKSKIVTNGPVVLFLPAWNLVIALSTDLSALFHPQKERKKEKTAQMYYRCVPRVDT